MCEVFDEKYTMCWSKAMVLAFIPATANDDTDYVEVQVQENVQVQRNGLSSLSKSMNHHINRHYDSMPRSMCRRLPTSSESLCKIGTHFVF